MAFASVFNDNGKGPMAFASVSSDTLRTYKWWTPGIGMPVFEIQLPNKTNLFNTTYAKYYDGVITSYKESEMLSAYISVFPNPTFHSLTIELNSIEVKHVMLTNSIGEIVWQQKENVDNKIEIDSHLLPSGIYFLSLITSTNERVVKQVNVIN